MYYTAIFYPRDDEYPEYILPGNFESVIDAVIACQVDIDDKRGLRPHYNDLNYYIIRQYYGSPDDEDSELGELIEPIDYEDELPGASLGTKVTFLKRGKRPRRISGEIINIFPDMTRKYFIVAELTEKGFSSSPRKQHLLKLNRLYTIDTF